MTENHPCTSPWMKSPWHNSPTLTKSSKPEIASYFFRKNNARDAENNSRRPFENLSFLADGKG